MIEIIIFDMDGTLLDSKTDITKSINFVREKKGLPPLTEDYVLEAINGPIQELSMKFYNTPQYEKSDRILFEEHYMQQCTKNVKVYDGVVELLNFCKEKNIKLSVATNAPTKFAIRMLEAAKILNYFDYVKGYDNDIPPKPNPDVILYLIEKFRKNNPLLIGDSEIDYLTAKNACINYILACWGFGIKNLSMNKDFVKRCKKVFTPGEIIKYII
ncbi:MAG: HAD family hydrolase [Deferribacterota bacterium]|nr:HAD family hydrolase [Deferribacterota bacterium]